MNTEVWVSVDLNGVVRRVGRLWARTRNNRQTASFQYDESWVGHPDQFALEPALTVDVAPFHTVADQRLFASIGDSAPDRWGRTLIRRRERQVARLEGRAPRATGEIDFLLGVSDFTRMGALRFSMEPDGPYLEVGGDSCVPPLVDLPRLLAATDRLLEEDETAEDLRVLLAPGSSLGGARPKASVAGSDGKLLIAKFPKKDDEWDIVRWEAVTLDLATAAGIETSTYRLHEIAGRSVLLLERFDRGKTQERIPFLSAMAMLNAQDMERRTYLEIADALTTHGADPEHDLEVLWRRMVFGVLVSNVDDHLRNHGFLYSGGRGWKMSPAYDLNPEPRDVNPGFLSTGIDDPEDRRASLELVLAVAEYFRIDEDQAVSIVTEVEHACARWREAAYARGISAAGVERMESAFEHEESALARTL